MSSIALTARGSSPGNARSRRIHLVARGTRTRGIIGALMMAVAFTACGPELHLSTSNLAIAPNPASPGDTVVASFILSLIPRQKHTIILRIDDREYLRVTSTEPHAIPVVINLGDAAGLLAQFGTGVHSALVVVSADESNETTRTRSITFELAATAPAREEP